MIAKWDFDGQWRKNRVVYLMQRFYGIFCNDEGMNNMFCSKEIVNMTNYFGDERELRKQTTDTSKTLLWKRILRFVRWKGSSQNDEIILVTKKIMKSNRTLQGYLSRTKRTFPAKFSRGILCVITGGLVFLWSQHLAPTQTELRIYIN